MHPKAPTNKMTALANTLGAWAGRRGMGSGKGLWVLSMSPLRWLPRSDGRRSCVIRPILHRDRSPGQGPGSPPAVPALLRTQDSESCRPARRLRCHPGSGWHHGLCSLLENRQENKQDLPSAAAERSHSARLLVLWWSEHLKLRAER